MTNTRIHRSAGLILAFASVVFSNAAAQMPPARSGDYEFSTTVQDVRALWLNPAGLAAKPIASLFGELSNARGTAGDWRLAQYSLGLSSRATGVGYQRNRFENEPGLGSWRLGGAMALTRLSLGASIEFHKGGRSWDAGLQYFPTPMVTFGLVVRNIGRPEVRDSNLPVVIVGGLTWRAGRSAVLSAEALATERHSVAGYDQRYRAGAQLRLPLHAALTAISAFDFVSDGSGMRLTRWSVGLALGGANQFLGVVSVAEPGAGPRSVDAYSLAAIARGTTRVVSRGPASPI